MSERSARKLALRVWREMSWREGEERRGVVDAGLENRDERRKRAQKRTHQAVICMEMGNEQPMRGR
jgi:hypothetical protein